MPIDNKQPDGTDVRRLEDCPSALDQEFDLSKIKIVVNPTSGFFGKWEGISDEEKIELDALAREHFQQIYEDNLQLASRCGASRWMNWIPLCG
ncbi:MAG: hypothetical protein V1719_02305 [Patescibacteria group bacterium]